MSNHVIKLWPESERPREKLSRGGPEILSDAELLALLLRSGVRGKDAINFSREILSRHGGLRGLFALSWPELQKIKGLGPAKISSLLAVSELSKRRQAAEISQGDVIRDPESVWQYLHQTLRDKKKEVFKVLFLNKANRMIAEKDLFQGTIDETAVHPREVIKAALDFYAAAVILVHNHPSGRLEPSPEDRKMTQHLKEACALVNVRVLDHLIIGGAGVFSFQEHGLL